jgi:hypothetical protein
MMEASVCNAEQENDAKGLSMPRALATVGLTNRLPLGDITNATVGRFCSLNGAQLKHCALSSDKKPPAAVLPTGFTAHSPITSNRKVIENTAAVQLQPALHEQQSQQLQKRQRLADTELKALQEYSDDELKQLTVAQLKAVSKACPVKIPSTGKKDDILSRSIAAATALRAGTSPDALSTCLGAKGQNGAGKKPRTSRPCEKNVWCPVLTRLQCMVCGHVEGSSEGKPAGVVCEAAQCNESAAKYGQSRLSQTIPSKQHKGNTVARETREVLALTEEEVRSLTGDKLKGLMRAVCTTISGKNVACMKEKVLQYQKAVAVQKAHALMLKSKSRNEPGKTQTAKFTPHSRIVYCRVSDVWKNEVRFSDFSISQADQQYWFQ